MKSVLSVQSHVAHGYVGGRSATFPLQYLGWDVDNINTVNFSNHTGYGSVKGSRLSEPEMTDLFEGLQNINSKYDAVISGYIPTCGLIDILAENVAFMKKANPNLLYICDTVMGDQGHFYVDNSCVEAYKKLLKRGIADLITPNQFELELLCGFSVNSAEDLRRAFNFIHNTYKVKHVVVSSVLGKIYEKDEISESLSDSILCAVSSVNTSKIELFKIPEIKSYFTGVGDLFTALLLDKFTKSPQDLPTAVSQVLGIMSNVLKLTHSSGLQEYCRSKGIEYNETAKDLIRGKINEGDSMQFFELRIIQARQYYDSEHLCNFETFTIDS